jgi:L-fucose isomerase
MDMDPVRPKAIWGFNGTERPGAVYLAATLAAHAQKGLPCFGIYGRDVQDAGDTRIPSDVEEKLLRFARAGLAAATMKGTTYLAMGGTSMGIGGSIVDPDFFQRWLGMRVMSVDMSEFAGRIERRLYDQEEFERAMVWVRAKCREGEDRNPPEKRRSRERLDREWEISVQMALIARDLMVGNPRLAERGFPEQALGHNAIAGGFQGQRQWTDYFPNGDFMEAILCSSFDWNGIRQPYVLATENDALNGVSMLFGNLLTGTAQLFADVRTYWSPAAIARVTGRAEDGVLHLINSGPAALDWTGQMAGSRDEPVLKPFWEMSETDVEACLAATLWCPSMTEYFPGGGWSTDFTTRGRMPVTMFRLNLVHGLGPVMQIVEGVTANLPPDVHDTLDLRTNPTWPTTWFIPRTDGREGPFKDAYAVMNAWGANHGAISYGHIGADLLTLCAILRLPVDMHNVAPEKVFRPAVWDRFGGLEPQGADFRACSTYGPLYG